MMRECKGEVEQSQIPLLAMLMKLGWEYLPPSEIATLRGDSKRDVLLEPILAESMQKINIKSIHGNLYRLSGDVIQKSIRRLKNIDLSEGLLKCNQDTTALLIDGDSQLDTLGGIKETQNVAYIDWNNWENNLFHCTSEYRIDRMAEDYREVDVVLFINGIPIGVIECKRYGVAVEEAIAQQLRNQEKNQIPQLYAYAQILVATGSGEARYATVGSSGKFWSEWKLNTAHTPPVQALINVPLSALQRASLLSVPFKDCVLSDERKVSPQDNVIYCLFFPAKTIKIMRWFMIFDGNIKKIARYQQYEVIENTLERMSQCDESGQRRGGIVWHTQGSGKSLTMMLLTRMIPHRFEKLAPQIILVTDRIELHEQLNKVFLHCNIKTAEATTGKNLRELIRTQTPVIMTLVHKFESALNDEEGIIKTGNNIFVLVDEGHRTQNGKLSSKMRQILPYASYVGFTGTPLLKTEKNSFHTFDHLIEPSYSIKQAVDDKAVVPLLYQGVALDLTLNGENINAWFDEKCKGMNENERAAFQKKYAQFSMIHRSENLNKAIVIDVNEHYKTNWKGTGFKAQMVVETKALAVKCKEMFDALGDLRTEVIISSANSYTLDEEEIVGNTQSDTQLVSDFWAEMMSKYHNEEAYNKTIKRAFSDERGIDILIVVSKLLTGFDEPRNTVLYLCKSLKEHTLLQAIARVNRLYEGKEYGYIIDYSNTLGDLNEALNMYNALDVYDADDIAETLVSVHEIAKLIPTHHKNLVRPFRLLKNRKDLESYLDVLTAEDLRNDFYFNLNVFTKSFSIVCNTMSFLRNTPQYDMTLYQKDLKFYQEIRAAARSRFADKEENFTKIIQKLLDENLGVNNTLRLGKPVNIFDVKEDFSNIIAGKITGLNTTKSQADLIARQTRRYVIDHLNLNPIFYQKYDGILKRLIEDYTHRKEADYQKYLNEAISHYNTVITEENNNVPIRIRKNKHVSAYYATIKALLADNADEDLCVEISLKMQAVIEKYKCVDFWKKSDIYNKIFSELEDYLYDDIPIELSLNTKHKIIKDILDIAQHRGVNDDY